jgi:hypothetical protein
MSIQTACFTLVSDWYKEHGAKPLPFAGTGYPQELVDKFAPYFTSEQVRVESDANNTSASNVMVLQLRHIPLVAGFLAGFDQKTLSEIAVRHDVDPVDFTYSFQHQPRPFSSDDGAEVDPLKIYAGCFKAMEALGVERLLGAYERCEEYYDLFGFGLSLMQSKELWPSTLLLQYQNAHQGKAASPETALRPGTFDYMFYVMDTEYLPMDGSGIRYDWFLERNGFLLPGITQKSLGNFTHWEDLIYLTQEYPQQSIFSGILDYCIHSAPDSMKPAIRSGLKSMMVDNSTYIDEPEGFMEFLVDKFEGTWLDGLSLDLVLQINMAGSTKSDALLYEYIQANAEVFQGMIGDLSESACAILRNLSARPADEFSLADFHALPYLIKHASTVDASISLESCILNLLRGQDWLMGSAELEFEDKDDIERISMAGCKAVMQRLAKSSHIDYAAFKGLRSDQMAALVEAGLDIRKLPKMNNRDRGRTLDMEMGL